MWEKLKASCFHSATMGVAYTIGAIGFFFQFVDAISYIYNTPEFKEWMAQALGGDTVLLGRVMLGISLLVAAARARTIFWAHKEDHE